MAAPHPERWHLSVCAAKSSEPWDKRTGAMCAYQNVVDDFLAVFFRRRCG
jgi:hypothetical protein